MQKYKPVSARGTETAGKKDEQSKFTKSGENHTFCSEYSKHGSNRYTDHLRHEGNQNDQKDFARFSVQRMDSEYENDYRSG